MAEDKKEPKAAKKNCSNYQKDYFKERDSCKESICC
jgi:hypothetical protein